MKYANIELVAHGTEENIEKFYDAFENRFEESEIGYDGKSASFGSSSDSFDFDDFDLADALVEFSKEYGLRIMYRAFQENYVPEEQLPEATYTAFETDEFLVEKGNVTKFQSKWYSEDNAENFLYDNDYEDFYEWMLDMPSYDELPEIA